MAMHMRPALQGPRARSESQQLLANCRRRAENWSIPFEEGLAVTHVTPEERQQLIDAVEKWEEYSAVFYVDRYLASVVESIIDRRLAAVPSETTPST